MAGQSSLSVQTATSGRQWSRNARTQGRTSTVANWWMQRSGSRSARNCAEVTVPVVTRQVSAGRACVQPAEHLEQRRRLADAGRVKPDELAVRPRQPGLAHPLAEPLGVFLALAAPPLQRAARQPAAPL